MQQPPQSMQRVLGLAGAVMMGLGSIVGTGVFVSIGIAAGVAGTMVLPAILIAALLATANGLSSAQLAASHAVSGGTYEYGYRYATPAIGFTAGWMFLLAKSASAATAALGFAGYVLVLVDARPVWLVPLALAVLIALTVIILTGMRRTNVVNIVIVSVTALSLSFFMASGLPAAVTGAPEHLDFTGAVEPHSLLYASALIFVAYTGYGRIATMGEEVREPRKNIPTAIIITLAISMALYLGVGAVAVSAVGAEAFAEATEDRAAPLSIIAATFNVPGAALILSIGAVTAMGGVLLNLLLGLSRVVVAMGRRGDLPARFARLDGTHTTPTAAVLAVAILIGAIALIGDVRLAWSFSALTVLIYYAITNLCALRLPADQRLYPRWIAWCGLIGCLSLAAFIEWRIWLAGAVLIVAGLFWHKVAQRGDERAGP